MPKTLTVFMMSILPHCQRIGITQLSCFDDGLKQADSFSGKKKTGHTENSKTTTDSQFWA